VLTIKPFKEISAEDYNVAISAQNCYFYHTIDLPVSGLLRGHWVFRGCESNYLGGIDVRGKTFFDCGVAGGSMAFEMERRGAQVVGLDLDIAQSPDMGLVPYADYEKFVGFSWEYALQKRHENQQRLRNSFLLGRKELGSKVRLLLGNIMYSPIEETADGALLGAILLHLRDPIAALYNVAQSVRETIVICDTLETDSMSLDEHPSMLFRPSIADPRTPRNVGTWWYSPPSLFRQVLEIVGFRSFEITKHMVKNDANGDYARHFTLVATR
jgi:hypothetical protein